MLLIKCKNKKVLSVAPSFKVITLSTLNLNNPKPFNEHVMLLWDKLQCSKIKKTDIKLNCFTLNVDTCQLSSFSVPAPLRQNPTVSRALVKKLTLTPKDSPSSLFHLHTSHWRWLPDYEPASRLPKASWCNTFSLSSPQKLFFFLNSSYWQKVLILTVILHTKQPDNTERREKKEKGETKKLEVLMSKRLRNANSISMMREWVMALFICFFL